MSHLLVVWSAVMAALLHVTQQANSTSPSVPLNSPLSPTNFVTVGGPSSASVHSTISYLTYVNGVDNGDDQYGDNRQQHGNYLMAPGFDPIIMDDYAGELPVFKHHLYNVMYDGRQERMRVVERHDGGGDWVPNGDSSQIFGILGVIEVERRKVVVAVTERKLVHTIPVPHNTIDRVSVYRVEQVLFVPINGGKVPNMSPLLDSVRELILSGWYYADSGVSLARRWTDYIAGRPANHTDDGFVANRLLFEAAINLGFPRDLLVEAIYGHVAIKKINMTSEDELTVALLTRTDCLNFGVRYKARGCNQDGHCGNTAETESLFILESTSTTAGGNNNRTVTTVGHVQVRGSVPLEWSEDSYTISVKSNNGFTKHLDWLKSRYTGMQVHLLSLLESDRGSRECHLHQRYQQEADKHRHQLHHFPYHSNPVSDEKWMSGLLVKLNRIADCGFTVLSDSNLIRAQSAVIRVNCLDCMDRAGTIQYALLDACMYSMLSECLLYQQDGNHQQTVMFLTEQKTKDILDAVKEHWQDASNQVSLHYAGTVTHQNNVLSGAKKTFTDTVKDGIVSFQRQVQTRVYDDAKNMGMMAVFRGSSVLYPSSGGVKSAPSSTKSSQDKQHGSQDNQQVSSPIPVPSAKPSSPAPSSPHGSPMARSHSRSPSSCGASAPINIRRPQPSSKPHFGHVKS